MQIEIIYTIFLIALAAILHSLDQIHSNRSRLTWLPRWLWSGDNWFNIPWPNTFDGFHIFKSLSRWCLFGSGYFFFQTELKLWWILILWLYHGQVFNLFYHFVWIKPEFRDWKALRKQD